MAQGILAIGLLMILLAWLPGIALTTLGPINKAAGAINAPKRFQISDLLWLSALLQGVLAFCIQTIDVNLREAFVPICGFLTMSVFAIWVAGVSFLSRAGVVSIWKRACLLLLSLPGTLAMMIGTPTAILCVALAVTHYFAQVAHGERSFDEGLAVVVAVSGIAGLAVLAAAAWGLRRLSLWIVGDEPPAQDAVGSSEKACLEAKEGA